MEMDNLSQTDEEVFALKFSDDDLEADVRHRRRLWHLARKLSAARIIAERARVNGSTLRFISVRTRRARQ
jgi:hypothetical protein